MLVGHYVPTKVMHVHNNDNPWFDDKCSRAFDLTQEALHRWTRDGSHVNSSES